MKFTEEEKAVLKKYFQERGRKAGNIVKEKYGRKHYQRMQAIGVANRRARKQEKIK